MPGKLQIQPCAETPANRKHLKQVSYLWLRIPRRPAPHVSQGVFRHTNLPQRSLDTDNCCVKSNTCGRLFSTGTSPCARYAAWAFRIQGIEACSSHEVFQQQSVSDGQMALLEVSCGIGPPGADPLLMEATELGMLPGSGDLGDVLSAARIEEHEKTGRLIGVCEDPIDRCPWVIHQGLPVDTRDRARAMALLPASTFAPGWHLRDARRSTPMRLSRKPLQ